MTILTVPAPPTVTITPFSLEAGSGMLSTGAPASSAWPAASRALFCSFRLWTPITAVKMFVLNGATVSGNIDVGIYDEAGTRLVSSGSTAHAGTSVIQVLDITDTQLGIGLFYMALALDGTTATVYRKSINVALQRATRWYQMAAAFPLPATATFAAPASNYVPLFGLSTDTVI
jgi:hypothetical protein